MRASPTTFRAVIAVTLAASAWACGGRTEILRDPRIQTNEPADGGIGDAPVFFDGAVRDGSGPDATAPDMGCTNFEIAPRPLVTPQPGDFFSPFRAVIDQTHFYMQRNTGRNRQIVRQPIVGGEEEVLELEPGTDLVQAHSGRLLFNRDLGQGQRVGIWTPQATRVYNDQIVRPRDGADSQFISGQVAAWRVNGQVSIATFGAGRSIVGRGVVAGPEVYDSAVYWVEQSRGIRLMSERRGVPSEPVSFFLSPEWMSAGVNGVAIVASERPFIWRTSQGRVDEIMDIPGECFASVSSRSEHAFLCSADPVNSIEIYLAIGTRGFLIDGLTRGTLGAVDFDGRYLAYVVFPPGEMFCPGGTEGVVNVFDIVTMQTHAVGSMTAPCLCCDRIGHFPRVQVFDDVVMWTGEQSTTLEFGAVRMEEQCEP